MMKIPAYATRFELYPENNKASCHLSSLFRSLNRIDFQFRVENPAKNQGQMVSDFDDELQNKLLVHGAKLFNLQLSLSIPQELDFAFDFQGKCVAVEIEKANREKILRDFLKCHMYLHTGADFALVVLPRNYPHSLGVWDLFDFGVQRFKECSEYSFCCPKKMDRILLLGYTQFDSKTDKPLSQAMRRQIRLDVKSAQVEFEKNRSQ